MKNYVSTDDLRHYEQMLTMFTRGISDHFENDVPSEDYIVGGMIGLADALFNLIEKAEAE